MHMCMCVVCVYVCVCRASPVRSLCSPVLYPPYSPPSQVFMRRECEAFGAGVDAIDLDGSKTGHVWWEGLGSSAREESRTPRTQKPPQSHQEPRRLPSQRDGSLDERLHMGAAD